MHQTTQAKLAAFFQRQSGVHLSMNEHSLTNDIQLSEEIALEERIREQSPFLQGINIMPMHDTVFNQLGLDHHSHQPLLSRTDTQNHDRKTQSLGFKAISRHTFATTQLDLHRSYRELDTLTCFEDYETQYEQHCLAQWAKGRITVGFQGEQTQANTNLTDHPNLSDLHRGWVQAIREEAPKQLRGSPDDAISIGENGTYPSLDEAVNDLIPRLDTWLAQSSSLVVLVGSALWRDYHLKHVPKGTQATHITTIPVLSPEGFPPLGLLLTSLDNLSIYWKQQSHRRVVVDNSERNRLEDYMSVDDCYVVEDYRKITGLDFKYVTIV